MMSKALRISIARTTFIYWPELFFVASTLFRGHDLYSWQRLLLHGNDFFSCERHLSRGNDIYFVMTTFIIILWWHLNAIFFLSNMFTCKKSKLR